MKSGLIALIAFVALILAAYVLTQQQPGSPSEAYRQLSGKQACASGETRFYACEGDELVWEYCSEGRWKKNQFNCKTLDENSFCNPKKEAHAECDLAQTQTSLPQRTARQETKPAGEATETPPPLFEASVPSTAVPPAYCGNGVCDASESCNTCVEDCGCSGSEVCAEGLCKIPPSCGGKQCQAGSFCNDFKQTCVTPLPIKKDVQTKVIQAYLNKETTLDGKPVQYMGAEDSYYGEKTVKILVFDCSTAQLGCRLLALVDEKGNVIEEDRTT